MFVHGANVLASDLISQYTSENACVFYFLHILLDTTLDLLTKKFNWEGFESGVYGTPPSFKYWARQAAVYVLALTTMKIIVIVIIIAFPGIFDLGEWLLSWTRAGNGDSIQVIFVMGIFPIIMNVLQFWLIDSIVKASTKSVALEDNESHDGRPDREPLFNATSDDEDVDYRHNDIERAPTRPRPHLPTPNLHVESTDSIRDDYKSGANSIVEDSAEHSYPPSLSTSYSSVASQPPRPAKNLLKNAKRRAAPTPLNVQNEYPPAVNSPGFVAGSHPATPMPIAQDRPHVHTDDSNDAWAEGWDDEEHWAHMTEHKGVAHEDHRTWIET
ncbi:hypothetical protein H0H93_010837 [Arthromyces matolae]|nr:hypothetical protein H0H93_010837 [Arthromyces matolae]